jgi:hypothetical protein
MMHASCDPDPSMAVRRRIWLPAAGLIALAAMVWVCAEARPLYEMLMHIMIKVPGPHPFVDFQAVASASRCWSHGVNVYVHNVCFDDVWPGQVFNYSPLWLRLPWLASLESLRVPVGILLCAGFMASLFLLPAPPGRGARATALLVLFSSAGWLALERSNFDLMMFVMIVAGIAMRGLALPWRCLGYALIACAGLLKFYPFMAMAVVLRERFTTLAAVAAASIAALACLVFLTHDELSLMAHGLPEPSIYTLQFGMLDLPTGLGATLARHLQSARHWDPVAARAIGTHAATMLLLVLALASATVACLIGRACRLPAALALLPPRMLDCAGAGAVLLCGCFFSGRNVIYRGIFLLLVLPALATLSRTAPTSWGRALCRAAGPLMVFVVWEPCLETMLFVAGLTVQIPYRGDAYLWLPQTPAGYALWLFSELAWWCIVTLLLAVAGAFVIRADAWADLGACIARMRKARGAQAVQGL